MNLLREYIRELLKEEVERQTVGSVLDALEAMKDFDTKGLVTSIGYGPNERRGSKMGRLVTVRNGELVTATDWIEAPPVPEAESQGK